MEHETKRTIAHRIMHFTTRRIGAAPEEMVQGTLQEFMIRIFSYNRGTMIGSIEIKCKISGDSSD